MKCLELTVIAILLIAFLFLFSFLVVTILEALGI